nr:hypothetical protein [uncultured Rhodopila sp.]
MKDTKNSESGKAGKPGESTATERSSQSAPKADVLTSEGVTSLLMSGLAEEPAEGDEAQPKAEDNDDTEERKPEAATEANEEAGEEQEPEAEKTPEGEEREAGEAGEETPELPAALEQAISEWEESGKGELPPALQGLVERRIGKLTGQREEERRAREAAEAQVRQLTDEVTQLRQDPRRAAAAAGSPVTDPKALEELAHSAESLVADAENVLDGTASEEETQRIQRFMESEHLDQAGLKRRVRELNKWLTGEVPKQKQAIQQFRAAEAQAAPIAKKFFPWLDQKDSPEYGMAQEVLGLMPELRTRTPAHRVALGVYVLGLKEFQKLQTAGAGKPGANGHAANGKRPGVSKVAPKSPVAGAASPRAARRGGEEDAARQDFERAPSRDSVEKLLRMGLRG